MEACEKVKAVIVADDAAGTVTMTLAQPWGPFIATLANSWGVGDGPGLGGCERRLGWLLRHLAELLRHHFG